MATTTTHTTTSPQVIAKARRLVSASGDHVDPVYDGQWNLTGTFYITGDSGNTYTTVFTSLDTLGRITGSCTCPAGEHGTMCAHLFAAAVTWFAFQDEDTLALADDWCEGFVPGNPLEGLTTATPQPQPADPFEGLV